MGARPPSITLRRPFVPTHSCKAHHPRVQARDRQVNEVIVRVIRRQRARKICPCFGETAPVSFGKACRPDAAGGESSRDVAARGAAAGGPVWLNRVRAHCSASPHRSDLPDPDQVAVTGSGGSLIRQQRAPFRAQSRRRGCHDRARSSEPPACGRYAGKSRCSPSPRVGRLCRSDPIGGRGRHS